MKELYILVSDGVDGSYYPKYTFNKEWIDDMEEKHESGEMNYEDGWVNYYINSTFPDERISIKEFVKLYYQV